MLSPNRPALSRARPARTALLAAAFVLAASAQACVLFVGPAPSHARKAEELRGQGDTDAAVAEYLKHIDERQKAEHRYEGENAYFYYLLIGDTYLDKGRIADAEEAYKTAQKNGVDKEQVVDRFRSIAKWLENQRRYEEAIEKFKQYRDLDPDIFDIDIDRVHKTMLRIEDHPEDDPAPGAEFDQP